MAVWTHGTGTLGIVSVEKLLCVAGEDKLRDVVLNLNMGMGWFILKLYGIWYSHFSPFAFL